MSVAQYAGLMPAQPVQLEETVLKLDTENRHVSVFLSSAVR